MKSYWRENSCFLSLEIFKLRVRLSILILFKNSKQYCSSRGTELLLCIQEVLGQYLASWIPETWHDLSQIHGFLFFAEFFLDLYIEKS